MFWREFPRVVNFGVWGFQTDYQELKVLGTDFARKRAPWGTKNELKVSNARAIIRTWFCFIVKCSYCSFILRCCANVYHYRLSKKQSLLERPLILGYQAMILACISYSSGHVQTDFRTYLSEIGEFVRKLWKIFSQKKSLKSQKRC